MDQTTQQNAALVEQMAAAAASLKGQAGELVQAVSVFKLSGMANASYSSAPRAAHAPAAKPTMKLASGASSIKPKTATATPKVQAKPAALAAPKHAAPKPTAAAPAPKPAATAAAPKEDDGWETF